MPAPVKATAARLRVVQPEVVMVEKQKPARDVVKAAAKNLKDGVTPPPATVRRESGRILADQKNDPQPHRSPAKKPRKGG